MQKFLQVYYKIWTNPVVANTNLTKKPGPNIEDRSYLLLFARSVPVRVHKSKPRKSSIHLYLENDVLH